MYLYIRIPYMKDQQIAIIVLHYKNLGDTIACLHSLQNLTYKSHTVYVVNNDTSKHAEELEKQFPEYTYIQNEANLGFAEGNNVGIRKALADDADAVVLLNNDTVVEPNFLTDMVKHISSNTQPPPTPLTESSSAQALSTRGGTHIGMVAPRMMQCDNKEKVDNLGVVCMSSGLPFNRMQTNTSLFCPSAGCALYTKKLLETVAIDDWYLDPLYFAYAEDFDLGFRARLAGFDVAYAQDAVVYHKGSASTSKVSDFAVYHTYRNLFWTQLKNFPLLLLLWQLPWLFFGWVSLFGYYLLKGKPMLIIKAVLDAVLGVRFIIGRRMSIQKNIAVSNKQILSWFATGLYPKGLKK